MEINYLIVVTPELIDSSSINRFRVDCSKTITGLDNSVFIMRTHYTIRGSIAFWKLVKSKPKEVSNISL